MFVVAVVMFVVVAVMFVVVTPLCLLLLPRYVCCCYPLMFVVVAIMFVVVTRYICCCYPVMFVVVFCVCCHRRDDKAPLLWPCDLSSLPRFWLCWGGGNIGLLNCFIIISCDVS